MTTIQDFNWNRSSIKSNFSFAVSFLHKLAKMESYIGLLLLTDKKWVELFQNLLRQIVRTLKSIHSSLSSRIWSFLDYKSFTNITKKVCKGSYWSRVCHPNSNPKAIPNGFSSTSGFAFQDAYRTFAIEKTSEILDCYYTVRHTLQSTLRIFIMQEQKEN